MTRTVGPDFWAPMRCPWPECQCTHTGGCNAGWLDIDSWDDPDGKAWARPCPNCRPTLAVRLRETGGDRMVMQQKIRKHREYR